VVDRDGGQTDTVTGHVTRGVDADTVNRTVGDSSGTNRRPEVMEQVRGQQQRADWLCRRVLHGDFTAPPTGYDVFQASPCNTVRAKRYWQENRRQKNENKQGFSFDVGFVCRFMLYLAYSNVYFMFFITVIDSNLYRSRAAFLSYEQNKSPLIVYTGVQNYFTH